MSHSITVYREVDDIYNPDPEATIEVAIEVEYDMARAEPDVGIMSAYVENWWVESTDSDLCDVAQAEAWLSSGEHVSAWQIARGEKPADPVAARQMNRILEADGDDGDGW